MEQVITATSPRIVLPDVSLAAIVRDELMNPAGGIVDFVDSTVPFVEEAAIVDTGSKDGTREALEELQARYPQLRVFDKKFEGYDSSRNFSLAQVRTKSVLVLDADERIREQDFSRLAEMKKKYPSRDYGFRFKNCAISKLEDDFISGHNPRLFLKEGKHYGTNYLCFEENLYDQKKRRVNCQGYYFFTDLVINHFVTTGSDNNRKIKDWYENVIKPGLATNTAPSDLPGFREWKRYNPRREEFR